MALSLENGLRRLKLRLIFCQRLGWQELLDWYSGEFNSVICHQLMSKVNLCIYNPTDILVDNSIEQTLLWNSNFSKVYGFALRELSKSMQSCWPGNYKVTLDHDNQEFQFSIMFSSEQEKLVWLMSH